jgi:hypothetical protein
MSYDISLYTKAFLQRALATNLGDWRNADPIPESAVEALIDAARTAGFVPAGGNEYLLDTPKCLAQLGVFSGELSFTIPYSDRADASIRLCSQIAKTVADAHGLAFWDPQGDEGE